MLNKVEINPAPTALPGARILGLFSVWIKNHQISGENNNDAHLGFTGLICFAHVVQVSSTGRKDRNTLYNNKK